MNNYTLVFIATGRSTVQAPDETIYCTNDAQALGEACKVFTRRPDVDVIEVWDDGRKVVSLGGRTSTTRWN